MTRSEGPKIFWGTDSNSTLVVTLPSKPQRRPTIFLICLSSLDGEPKMRFAHFCESTMYIGTYLK